MNSKQQIPSTRSLAEQSDGELLRHYRQSGSQSAFAELTRRYANLVYATCLRETGERTLAEDAAQGVFLLLSRKADTLRPQDTLAGWLYAAARNVARNLEKQERRRRMNEAEAALAATPVGDAGSVLWERIEPHLHDALDRLKPLDRDAILLRYVAEQSFAQVGSQLGLSENTARMRINRAIEKLRVHIGKAGIAVSLAALAVLLEEQAAQAAPADLLPTLAQIAAPHASIPLPASTAQAIRGVPLRTARFSLRTAATAIGALVLLAGFAAYHWNGVPPLNAPERTRLFASLAGVWKGTLEFADDKTRQHFTYPTTVTIRAQGAGDALTYTAAYEGSAAVDVTTLSANARTGELTVTNGGPQSSHGLAGVGKLMRMRGGYAFEGKNGVLNTDVRLLITPSGNRLTMQEDYRNLGQADYQFRNRFTLSKQ